VSSRKPPWWRAFDKVERAIGVPLENAAASNRYVDVMLRGMRVQRAIGGGVGRVLGGTAERVLRVANIPTRSDVRRLNRQIAVLTSEVRTLSAQQRESLGETNAHPDGSPASQQPDGQDTQTSKKTPGGEVT
jgi:hypothetical protein